MNIYTCNDFKGFWPVGTAAVIVADDTDQAERLLIQALKDKKLPTDDFTLVQLNTEIPVVRVLRDGDY